MDSIKQFDFFGNEIEPKNIKHYNKVDFSDLCGGNAVYCERCKWQNDPAAVECVKGKNEE